MKKLLPWLFFLSLAAPAASSPSPPIDRIVVEKGAHRMILLAGGQAIRTYRIALGRPEGAKETEGDMRTPEGLYFIEGRNRASRFHRSLRISYPSAEDQSRARTLGLPPGGDIMIHGLPAGRSDIAETHHEIDWTRGCIAVNNAEIEEIWRLVADGTPIEIRP